MNPESVSNKISIHGRMAGWAFRFWEGESSADVSEDQDKKDDEEKMKVKVKMRGKEEETWYQAEKALELRQLDRETKIRSGDF